MNMVSIPFERIKILLQTQAHGFSKGNNAGRARQSRVDMGILRRIYHQGGIRSFYRGSLLTFARDGPDSAAYFATYEYCKRRFTTLSQEPDVDGLSLLAVGGAGAIAGIIMLVPLFPIDTLKSRKQSSKGRLGVTVMARTLYRQDGLRAFYPGLVPALLRALPANAAATLGWEVARHALYQDHPT